MSVAFTLTGIAHFGSDLIVPYIEINAPQLAKFSLTSNFFWIIVISTSLALFLSFTKIRNLRGGWCISLWQFVSLYFSGNHRYENEYFGYF